MRFDYRDALAVAGGSTGLLLGALVGIALERGPVVAWMGGGLLLGAGLSAYLLSAGGASPPE